MSLYIVDKVIDHMDVSQSMDLGMLYRSKLNVFDIDYDQLDILMNNLTMVPID